VSAAPIPPGGVLGILGGGQLGRMIAGAAADLGIRTHVFAPEERSPAGAVADAWTRAAFDDEAALDAFADAVDVATIEWENVPVAALERIAARGVPVRPSGATAAVTQDRVLEKTFLNDAGVETAPWRGVDDLDGLRAAIADIGAPAILKTRRLGYDGKGQAKIASPGDAVAAWAAIDGAPAILEGFVPFACEASVVLARTLEGDVVPFDIARNEHEGGILRRSVCPSGLDGGTEARLFAAADRVARRFADVGVIAVEFFVMADGAVVANEIAPRVHNSGHWTPEACDIGQFEQHVRAVCGWPARAPVRYADAEMRNLLGPEADDWLACAGEDGARLVLYGKGEARRGRKMGHVTRLAPKDG